MSFNEIMRSGGWVWLALVVLSISNFVIGEDLGIAGHWEIIALMVIRNFMEVKDGPLALRIVFDVWCVLAPSALIAVVLMGERGMLS